MKKGSDSFWSIKFFHKTGGILTMAIGQLKSKLKIENWKTKMENRKLKNENLNLEIKTEIKMEMENENEYKKVDFKCEWVWLKLFAKGGFLTLL